MQNIQFDMLFDTHLAYTTPDAPTTIFISGNWNQKNLDNSVEERFVKILLHESLHLALHYIGEGAVNPALDRLYSLYSSYESDGHAAHYEYTGFPKTLVERIEGT